MEAFDDEVQISDEELEKDMIARQTEADNGQSLAQLIETRMWAVFNEVILDAMYAECVSCFSDILPKGEENLEKIREFQILGSTVKQIHKRVKAKIDLGRMATHQLAEINKALNKGDSTPKEDENNDQT